MQGCHNRRGNWLKRAEQDEKDLKKKQQEEDLKKEKEKEERKLKKSRKQWVVK